MFKPLRIVTGAVVLASLTLGAVAIGRTVPAQAVFSGADISSAGPLTHIYIGANLSCQVAHTGDVDFEMYPEDDQEGDCTTAVEVDGTVYGYSSFAGTDYDPVSQTAVTGSGTSGDPYQVVTVVDADDTGIRITQTDSYVVGDEFYRTDVQVSNAGNSSVPVSIYRGADCFLGSSDEGYGFADTVGKTVGCTENANNSPAGRVELWTPITPADHYYEAEYFDVESAVDAGDTLPDTCICTTFEDNGAALQWDRTIGAGQSATVSHYTTFSPTGLGAPSPTPGGPTNTPGAKTATPVVRIKTHTPTATATAKATDTPLPATNTPVVVPTLAPTRPSGGAAGQITGPDTGSGPGESSRNTFAALIAGAALLAAGAGALTIGRRVRSRS